MMKPFISVIIPVYNAEQYIDACISSILNQTYDNYEIIICDDCSTDNTRMILEKYKSNEKVRIFYNEKNMHQAQSRNLCVRECKGDYIMLQDADDFSEPERMEKLLGAFEDNISFVGSSCNCFDDGEIYQILKLKKTYPQKKDLLWGIPFAHPSMMFRKDAFLAVGGYRVCKYTQRGEDYDLILRLYAKGYRGKNIDELLYDYRLDRNTYARRTFRARLDECLIRYYGFKDNKILFPWGWLWVLKPIPAHFYQMITVALIKKQRR